MNTQKYFAFVGIFILVIGFQNCSKSNFEAIGLTEQSSKLQSASQENQEVVAAPGLPHPDKDVVVNARGKVVSVKGYDPLGQSEIRIELALPGTVTIRSTDTVIVAGCLDSKRLNFLRDLLREVSLCQSDRISDSSVSCTQEYTPAYASLEMLGTHIPLGAGNACSGGQVYFCGESAQTKNVEQQLKVFFRYLKNNLDTLKKCE